MANKTANVNARIEMDVKKKAEGILAEMGIPTSVAINMFYHQIINTHGLPFRPVVPMNRPKAVNEMTKAEFDAEMQKGMDDIAAGRVVSIDEVEAEMQKRYGL